MPGKGRLQFLKELREKGNHISFVLFSGEDKDEIKIEALCFGADGYFNKIGRRKQFMGSCQRELNQPKKEQNEIEVDKS